MANGIKVAVETGAVIETLRKVGEENPDHVDKNAGDGACLYFDRTTGERCIVGQVFYEHGVDDSVLLRTRGAVAAALQSITGDREGTFYESLSYLYLSAAQGAQDSGLPWGLAVQYAEDAVNDDERRIDVSVDTWVEGQGEDFPWVRSRQRNGFPGPFVKLAEAELPA